MRYRILVGAPLVAIFLSNVPVGAAPPRTPAAGAATTICGAMERIIAADEQEISDQTADQLTEDSAPRATVEELKINAAYQEIQANLALMAQHHCVPYNHPIGASYLADAIRCKTDRMKGVLSGNVAIPDSCDRAKWTRMN